MQKDLSDMTLVKNNVQDVPIDREEIREKKRKSRYETAKKILQNDYLKK